MRACQSMIGHSWDCRYKHPSCDAHSLIVTYNCIRVCFECYRTNTYGIEICLCVKKDDPPNLIRTHLIADACAYITDQVIPPDAVFHYIPDDFPPCGDKKVCPRGGRYRQCQGAIKHPQCTNLIHKDLIMCANCVNDNKCSVSECPGYVTTRAEPKNQSMQLCEGHYVFVCITCKQEKVEYDYRTQCGDCDIATNSIVCCNAVHKPHSLTYPRIAIECIHCINCNCAPVQYSHVYDSYWRLIQTAYIWKLYETVAASPARRYVSFATALMLHLTWRGGDVECMWHAGESACVPYILSQRTCAASALMRVRWLPQPLRLMILGYV
jgi:hypothetical protein